MREPGELAVLYVCTANICRSPFMELWSRHAAGPDSPLRFASAGTQGYRGSPMADEMRPALAELGVDADTFRSRRVTAAMLDEADLVLTAERSHRTFLLDDHPTAFRKVLTLGQAAAAATQVDPEARGRDAVVELSRARATADPADDVDDPYRRGPEAAARCAATVTSMLSTLLPVLDPTLRER